MKYDFVAGTGGIGAGEIFRLVGNATLGREESRSAELTGYRDYCKLHIILSYTGRLIGGKIPVFACGRVGNDDRGERLLCEMRAVNIRTDYVRVSPEPTKYSVCFLYPNGDGGNITSVNDACGKVSGEELKRDIEEITRRIGGRGIVLGAPEVPLAARLAFLKRARELGHTTVSSVLCDEATEFLSSDGAAVSDIIAVNSDEIRALGGGNEKAAEEKLFSQNPKLKLIVTRGKAGAEIADGNGRIFVKATETTVVSTAGAGDALLGGTIARLGEGENLEKAILTGRDLAAIAVASPHTIPDEI